MGDEADWDRDCAERDESEAFMRRPPMTRLYTEADVRAMLVKACAVGRQAERLDALGAPSLDEADSLARILSTTPVAAPDLSRADADEALEEALRAAYFHAARIYEPPGCNNQERQEAEVAIDLALAAYVEHRRSLLGPVAPDLSRLAEAVREAAAKVCGGRARLQASSHAARALDEARDTIRSLDLAPIITSITNGHAPIIAASGTGQGEASLPVLRHCGDCRYGHQVLGIRDHEHRPQGACMNDAMLPSPVESRVVDVYEGAPPPAWCPLRTPRKEQKR